MEIAVAEHASELTGIAFVLAIAAIAGMGFIRFGQPPIIGYILAGVALGPTGLGLVSNTGNIALLAELGVILLLFLVGMGISVRAFVLVLKPAVLTALGQLIIGLCVTFSFGYFLDWPVQRSLLLGFIVAVSSTAVAMKMLEEIGDLRNDVGRITVGVLIAQDIAIVPMLILIDSFGNMGGVGMQIYVVIKLAVSLIVLAVLFYFLGQRGKIRLPFSDSVKGKADVIALGALAFCFTAAAISSIAGLSPAYGAFLAGLVIAHSTLRAEALHVTYPIQSVLVVIFFLSIGLLIDLNFVFANWGTILAFVIGVILVKTVINIAILHAVGEPWENAFPAGLMMAQIGEFSFVLAAAGIRNGAIDIEGYKLAVAVIAITLLVSPIWMSLLRKFHDAVSQGPLDFGTVMSTSYWHKIDHFKRWAKTYQKEGKQCRLAILKCKHNLYMAWWKARQRKHMAQKASSLFTLDNSSQNQSHTNTINNAKKGENSTSEKRDERNEKE